MTSICFCHLAIFYSLPSAPFPSPGQSRKSASLISYFFADQQGCTPGIIMVEIFCHEELALSEANLRCRLLTHQNIHILKATINMCKRTNNCQSREVHLSVIFRGFKETRSQNNSLQRANNRMALGTYGQLLRLLCQLMLGWIPFRSTWVI